MYKLVVCERTDEIIHNFAKMKTPKRGKNRRYRKIQKTKTYGFFKLSKHNPHFEHLFCLVSSPEVTVFETEHDPPPNTVQ
eukprot:UN00816